jgi:GGDEF domain-containing protein
MEPSKVTPYGRGRPTTPSTPLEQLQELVSNPEMVGSDDNVPIEEIVGSVQQAAALLSRANVEDPNVSMAIELLSLSISQLVRKVGKKDEESRELQQRLGDTASRLGDSQFKNRALKTKAYSDRLTGLGNQAAILEYGPLLFEKTRKLGKPFSCLFFDLDYFKNVNDTYGHGAGDEVLRELAKRMSATLRTSDFSSRVSSGAYEACDVDADEHETHGETLAMTARAGGEEFSVLLPGTALDGACIAAERLREAIESTLFIVHDKSGQEHTIKQTISIGVGEASSASDFNHLRRQVDAALYEAKDDGRNATVRAELDADGHTIYSIVSPSERHRSARRHRNA